MATKGCGPKSKWAKDPEHYDCVNGRSVLKKEFRQPRVVKPRTKCTESHAGDDKWECNEKTNFQWKLKKGFKMSRVVGAPKRPLSAYFLWMGENRAWVAQATGLKGKELASALGSRWKALTEVEQAPFKARAAMAKEAFERELEHFKAVHEGQALKEVVQKPKRAPSAWVLFSKDERPKVKAQHPEWTFGQISTEVGARWRKLHPK